MTKNVSVGHFLSFFDCIPFTEELGFFFVVQSTSELCFGCFFALFALFLPLARRLTAP